MIHRQLIRCGFWIFAITAILGPGNANACTIGVISGKATIDGRPLLWKNRDATFKNNQVRRFTGGKFACTAIVNAGQNATIWMGINDAGFCIENSVTSDLSEEGAKGMGNGSFLLRALKTSATVEGFEELLRQTNGKRSTNANFGVIDAIADGGVSVEYLLHSLDHDVGDVGRTGVYGRRALLGCGTQVATELSGDKTSPLCDAARALRDAAYVEVITGNSAEEKRLFFLETQSLPLIWKETLPWERQQLSAVAEALNKWRSDGFDPSAAELLHRSTSSDALDLLQRLASPQLVELR